MKKKTALTLCLLIGLLFNGFSQKLPNVQELGVRAPDNIKIDGKAKEWKDTLKSYNKATQLYYTVSNDDENLYLIVKADNARAITKIIDVGISFIINLAGKRNSADMENIVITYPLLDFAPGQQILWYACSKVRSGVSIPKVISDNDTTSYSDKPTDSLIAIANKLLGNNAKNLKVTGVKDISEPLISVYNEERILSSAHFGKGGVYIYELAIPFKYIGLDIKNPQKFSYSLHLESRLTNPKSGMQTRYVYPNGHAQDVDQDLDSTTDFWGLYTLVKSK